MCPSSSNDLNIASMYAMIRTTANIHNPKNGWGRIPDENDEGLADDIERIRFYKNYTYHTDAMEMDTSTFNDCVLDLIGVNMVAIFDIHKRTHFFSHNGIYLKMIFFSVTHF